IFPARQKLSGNGTQETMDWHADLIEYRGGVLISGELFRSTGHWNKAQQIEIFQTLCGRVVMLVAGYGHNKQQYLHHYMCQAGDICIVPPGAWHITYVLTHHAQV